MIAFSIMRDSSRVKTRQALRHVVRNTTLPGRMRAQAQLRLAQMHCYTRRTQIRNRCLMGGKTRGILRDFRMSRVSITIFSLSACDWCIGVTQACADRIFPAVCLSSQGNGWRLTRREKGFVVATSFFTSQHRHFTLYITCVHPKHAQVGVGINS